MEFAWTGMLFAALLMSAEIGWSAARRLSERHVTRDTIDSIRLIMGMLLTFSALVLGLLTSSAKARFDGFDNDLSVYSADLIELDNRLRLYGPDADDIRTVLRRYTAAAIADTWPQEAAPPGAYPRFRHGPEDDKLESDPLGGMLAAVDGAIARLDPVDGFHVRVAEQLRGRMAVVTAQRWTIIFSGRSTISAPLLVILTAWLCIIYAILCLTAPRNRLVYTVVLLSALSIASPLYLILDYDEARTGLLHSSSESLRSALEHMQAQH